VHIEVQRYVWRRILVDRQRRRRVLHEQVAEAHLHAVMQSRCWVLRSTRHMHAAAACSQMLARSPDLKLCNLRQLLQQLPCDDVTSPRHASQSHRPLHPAQALAHYDTGHHP